MVIDGFALVQLLENQKRQRLLVTSLTALRELCEVKVLVIRGWIYHSIFIENTPLKQQEFDAPRRRRVPLTIKWQAFLVQGDNKADLEVSFRGGNYACT